MPMPVPESAIKLAEFLPYQLAVVTESVSRSIAQAYGARFALHRDEWRVLAALAESGEMHTKAAALYTTLDKMQVSRAVAGLESRALIERIEDPEDRRNRILRLTPAGRALLARLMPMVRAREAFLLEALTPGERAGLSSALAKILERANQLQRQG